MDEFNGFHRRMLPVGFGLGELQDGRLFVVAAPVRASSAEAPSPPPRESVADGFVFGERFVGHGAGGYRFGLLLVVGVAERELVLDPDEGLPPSEADGFYCLLELDAQAVGVGHVERAAGLADPGSDLHGLFGDFDGLVGVVVVLDGETVLGAALVCDAIWRVGPDA